MAARQTTTVHRPNIAAGEVVGRRFRQVARAAGLVVTVIGGAGLAGWIFDVPILKSVIPGMVTMKANTATCFLLAGIALRLNLDPGGSLRRRWIARACGGLAAAVGILTLAQYLFGVDLRIDQLLVRAPPVELATSSPGRMAPNTAFNFVLLGITLVFLDSPSSPVRRALQWLAILALLVAFVATVGYLYQVRALVGVAGFTHMAIPTAIGFTALSLGVLAARPEGGVAAILAQDNQAGSGLRRLLPIIVVAPAALGWPLLKGHQLVSYSTEFGLAVLATLSTAVLASAAFWRAWTQGLTETARQQAVDDERFLLELGELLRTSTEAATTLFAVASKLGRYLGASRCLFTQLDADRAFTHQDYCDGVASLAGTIMPLESLGPEALAAARAGHTVVSNDTQVDPRTADQYQTTYGPRGLRARIVAPLLRDGRLVGTLLVASGVPRVWQSREVLLIQTVGERTWLWFEHLAEARERVRADEQFRLAIEAAPTGMMLVDEQGRMAMVNGQIEKLFGYGRDQLIGQSVDMLVPGRFRAGHAGLRASFLRAPRARAMGAGRTLFGLRQDGSEVPVEIGLTPLHMSEGEFVLTSIVDITERERSERDKQSLMDQLRQLNADLEERVRGRTAELTHTLREREVLLQEIHHRVKNNLQVIGSLMNLQTRQLSDVTARTALQDCRARVEAIALIHEKLYQAGDYSRIPFADYARSLASSIFQASGALSAGNVALNLNIGSVALELDQAIPCGLILNELMTNALKHAFPDGRSGSVLVELRTVSDRELCLSVQDDGVGLPSDFAIDQARTLGMHLVSSLVKQLDGRLEIGRNRGARFSVTFPATVPA
jgi:PAS domain S-box-containing protein